MAKKQPEDQAAKAPAQPNPAKQAKKQSENQESKASVKPGPAKQAKKQPDAQDAKVPARQNPITRFIKYVEASRAELRKVTWPTLKETRKATIAVLSFVAIMAIVLGLIDLGLSSLVKTILS